MDCKGCHHNIDGLQRRRTRGVVLLADSGDDPQGGKHRLQRYWPGGIYFHDALHGFHAGRGTGTAILETKLLHQIISMRYTALHSIFLELCKAYDDLDRYRCLDILEGYGVGPRRLHKVWTY